MKFLTQNGTWYEINQEKMTWQKLSTANRSGKTRTESGKLLEWPKVKMGEPVFLKDSIVRAGFDAHFVQTSCVVAIKE